MTDDLCNDPRAIALGRAVDAAEGAAQAVACLWEMLHAGGAGPLAQRARA